MKSIRQWMEENGMVDDQIKNIDLTRILGGSSVKIDRKLAVRMGPKLDQVLNDEDFASESKPELLRQVIAIAAEKIGGISGSQVGVRKLAGGLNQQTDLGSDEPIAQEVK